VSGFDLHKVICTRHIQCWFWSVAVSHTNKEYHQIYLFKDAVRYVAVVLCHLKHFKDDLMVSRRSLAVPTKPDFPDLAKRLTRYFNVYVSTGVFQCKRSSLVQTDFLADRSASHRASHRATHPNNQSSIWLRLEVRFVSCEVKGSN